MNGNRRISRVGDAAWARRGRYINRAAMLTVGTSAYALFFVVSFPNVFWLDAKWTVWNCVVQASFAAMWALFLDTWPAGA